MKSIRLWLLFIGSISFLCYFSVPAHPKFLVLVGWLTWLSAYLELLVNCYTKAVPLPTMFGSLEKDKRPALYQSMYLWMVFVGVFTVLVSLLITFTHK